MLTVKEPNIILIISESSDQSTNNVLDWLRFYKHEYVRINEKDVIKVHSIDINNSINPNITFSVNNEKKINTDRINAYWFRRGLLNFFNSGFIVTNFKNKDVEDEIRVNLTSETTRIGDMFQFIIEKKNKVGSSYTADNNKLIHMIMAKKAGIDVPYSIISTSKRELRQFYRRHKSGIITKAISDGISIRNSSQNFKLYTNIVTKEDVERFPDFFAPTLIQEYVKKTFEIRVFFIKGRFYSMAIFSQNDDKTEIDFRRYNKEKQNYRVPFNLPKEIKVKLKKFMHMANLDCGSIDILYSLEKKYYFLEVNPVGQFGMISTPCNYKLGKNIALELIKP